MPTEIDECLSQPCLNGGRCKDRVAEFLCLCEPGYTGHHCESGKRLCQACSRAAAGSCSKSFLIPQSLQNDRKTHGQELVCGFVYWLWALVYTLRSA